MNGKRTSNTTKSKDQPLHHCPGLDLFPYTGYFQLIAQSDVFVILDDAQYIKGGWINRNRILRNGEPCWITLPVAHASHALPINQRSYQLTPKIRHRTRRQIESCYRKAPHFAKVLPLVREVLDCEDANVATYNENLITRVCEWLQLRTRMVRSSELERAVPRLGRIASSISASGSVQLTMRTQLAAPTCTSRTNSLGNGPNSVSWNQQ
jgi:hypothetical protein